MKKERHLFLVSLYLIGSYLNAQQKTQLSIKGSNNDVEITTSSNAVNYTSTGLDLHGGTASSPIETYIRFQGISLPTDAVIKSANLIFYGRTASSLGTTVTIFGEIGSSDAYPTSTAVATATSIRARQYTSDSVTWDTPNCVASKEYITPDVTNLLLGMFPDGVGNTNASFKLTGNQKGSFIMWSYDGSATMAPKLEITYTSAYGTFTTTVAANTDDGRENTSGSMYLSDNYINLGGRSDSGTSAVRFPVVEIPEKAEILEAYIEFYSYGTSPASAVNIYTELANAVTYATTSGNITKRNYSTNTVNWFTESWIVSNTPYKTPDLKNIIDATRLSGWKSGEAIGFKFVGALLNNGATANTNEMGELYKPRLVIKYKTEGNGPNVETNPLNGVSASVISSGNDDSKEYNNGNMSLGDSYMYLGGRSDISNSGFIFQNTQIPADAEIKDAYIEFYAYATSPATTIDIYAEMAQKTPYTSYSKSITARNYTNNKINWVTSAWTTDLAKNRTPNLRNIIDEIRLNGWKSGENIAFKLNGMGLNDGAKAYTYEGSTLYRPRLVVEYDNNSAGPGIIDNPEEIQTYESIVATGYDDGRENVSGSMYLSDAYLSLAGQSDSYKTGIRFQTVEFPSNAEITEAYIEFYAYDKSNATTVSIKSEIGDAQIYSTVKNNISSRTYSENTELWNTDTRVDYAQNRTVDIKKLIDENRLRGWEPGQGLAFLFEGKVTSSNYARVRSFEAGNMYKPRLVIKYKDNQKGPNAAAVISAMNNVITDPSKMTGLVINEVSAQGSVAQKEDWVELYNSLDKTILIDGNISISNKDTKKDLCVLKNILIPAKGFTVLIADKKPEKGNRHLNFDLKNTGSVLYLSTLAGKKTTALDELQYIETPYNTSYGRSTDASATLTTFINPTYNLSNSVGQQKLALSFSTERGVYATGFDVTITAPPGSTVNYTLDGKFPSKTVGTKYTVPISVTQSCVLKVYAYDATGNSGVISHTYVLQDNYKNELSTSHSQWSNKAYILTADEYSKAIAELPVVAISTNSELDGNWAQGSFEYLDKHIYSDRTNFFSNSITQKFGQASASQFNGGVKFKFNKDSEVKKANYPFFDAYPGEVYPTSNKIQSLELKEGQDGPQNNIYNIGYLRFDEKITMNLCKEIGKYALDTRFVHFFVNGKYRGVKTMRNDFRSNNLEEVFGDDADNYTTVDLQDGNFTGGVVDEGNGSTAIWQNIKKHAASNDFQGFKNWVDVEDLIKFQIMFMFVDTENEATAIVHNYAPTFMKAKININDTDGAFFGGFTSPTSSIAMPAQSFVGGGGNYKYKWGSSTSKSGPAGLFGSFMGSNTNQTTGNLEFKTLVKDYVQAAFGDSKSTATAPLSVNNVQNKIKNAMSELNNVYKLDAAYMSYNKEVYNYWKNVDGPRVLAQVPERVSYSLQKWQEYNMLHTLLAAPFNTAVAGHVTIINSNEGTQVYYTIDGSDPMGNDGMISPSALKYNSAEGIVLPSGTYSLVSRAFITNNWGPLSKANINGKVMTKRTAESISEEILNTEAQNVVIYPNPALNEVNIDLKNDDAGNSQISIYSIYGNLVQNNTLTNQFNTVNISNLNPGYYIIKIVNSKGTVSTHKLIKK